MKAKLFTSAMACALLVACNVAPTGTPTKGAATPEESSFLAASQMTPRYQRMVAQVDASADVAASAGVSVSDPLVTGNMAAHATLGELGTAKVGCSSQRNDFFKLDFLTDGNLHSAWGAAADDANPTLTFDLKACTTLRGLGIKQSGGVKFDVAVQVGNGAWTVIGTDLTAQAAMLDWVDLKATAADRVQLRFHGENVGKLLVCEVKWFGDACGGGGGPTPMPSMSPSAMPSGSPSPSTMPSASPSTMPSSTPTPAPTTSPSTQPSTMPSDHCGCKVTGGGFLRLGVGKGSHKVTFGFVAMEKNGTVKGNLELNDHLTKAKFHAKITTLTCDDHSATFGGTLAGTTISWSATVNAGQQLSFSVNGHVVAAGTLAGGMIKFHEDHDCSGSDEDDVKLCQADLEALHVHCDANLNIDLHDIDDD
jgi:hypothetical protein